MVVVMVVLVEVVVVVLKVVVVKVSWQCRCWAMWRCCWSWKPPSSSELCRSETRSWCWCLLVW